ncbi:hypothetical protein IEO21_08141 [Rhodonia placenta]|uniref:BTB domain-containing protein n=1 Tax=Rhodonia placenta TaxID=104341 RepID=A0A8H7NWZ3_9APHY|nr:hypothetical protein IEO21_08141 [Postia placenta]
MNPPHILIARNSRGPNIINPSASLSSPTETHAAAAGIFRSSGDPPYYLEECESDEMVSALSIDGDYEDPIEIDETFTEGSRFPGTVKIIVEATTFWAHKEVLYFASSFFKAALSGDWAETGRPRSMSSVITISQPPSVPGSRSKIEDSPELTFAPVDPDTEPEDIDLDPVQEHIHLVLTYCRATRRTWFLERVLKLGLIQVAKEYQCCSTCPDPTACARLLEEKWKQAYHAVFRFGPCQPSMVFRYLRTLEGVSPPLSLTHLSCQNTAKAFVATLFDRMFSLGIRGSGTDPAPLGRVAAVAGTAPGPRRHFLFCSLKSESTSRGKRSRDFS